MVAPRLPSPPSPVKYRRAGYLRGTSTWDLYACDSMPPCWIHFQPVVLQEDLQRLTPSLPASFRLPSCLEVVSKRWFAGPSCSLTIRWILWLLASGEHLRKQCTRLSPNSSLSYMWPSWGPISYTILKTTWSSKLSSCHLVFGESMQIFISVMSLPRLDLSLWYSSAECQIRASLSLVSTHVKFRDSAVWKHRKGHD